MGYLKDFRENFAKRIEALDPEEMKEALNFATNALLESYRNGQKAQGAKRKDARGAKGKCAKGEGSSKR